MLIRYILGLRFWHSHAWVAGTENTFSLISDLHYKIIILETVNKKLG
jgi:hypothetical protein